MNDQRVGRVELLDKVVAILGAFHDEEALTPFDIACTLDMPVSSVYRLTQALESHGWLRRDGKRYRLGLALMHLGALVTERIDLRRSVTPSLRWLNEQTGENAEFHVRQDNARVIVDVVSSTQNLRPFVHMGQPFPLHRGAGGRVLLAWLPREEQLACAYASHRRFPDLPLEPEDTLLALLEAVRAEGVYHSEGERSFGVSSIAAPLFDASGAVVGAVATSVPSVRLPAETAARYKPLVIQAAQEASRTLGFTDKVADQGPRRHAEVSV